MRGTLQSQNQSRFVDEIDEEYWSQLQGHQRGTIVEKGKNNYHSPV